MGSATPALDDGATVRAAIREHAATQSPERRRALGSHATPAALARTLVDVALGHLGGVPSLVVDPSCGAGSFLLAAAEALVALDVPPEEVVRRLAGCDVDPRAVAHCRSSLRTWAADHGVAGSFDPTVVELDPLRTRPPFAGRVDLVVGNPPFLAQRTADTARDPSRRDALRRRFGDLGPYVDDAAAFLLVGSELLAPGGVAVLIQPQSVLAARDAANVRDRLMRASPLVALWADAARHFGADVEVCAPVFRRRVDGGDPDAPGGDVEIRWGSDARSVGPAPVPDPGASWGPLLAPALGVPVAERVVRSPAVAASAATIGDVATTVAGFRDEFYALAAAARVDGDEGWSPTAPRLVTAGMIDLARLDVRSTRRLGGRRVVDPRLDLAALSAAAPRVADWVSARRVPKVLVATQTKVPEAVADPTGDLVPVTPVISVEPRPGGVDVWHLLAALGAPTVAASVARTHAGSGLSLGAVRLSAPSVRSLPLPSDRAAWTEGAAIARALQTGESPDRSALLGRLGEVMVRAHGTPVDPALLRWWTERADRSSGRSRDERA